jgi:threonine aldolase
MEKILQFARAQKIPVHLDGARVFNAAVALGVPVEELTRPFDSVMFCFSKGLGAPVGSMLVGSREFIDEARVVRKRLGGGMRQVGVLAAACLYALDHHVERLAEDHEHAKLLANALSELDGVVVTPPETNIQRCELSRIPAAEFARKLGGKGVLVIPISGTKVRMVTHLDVSRKDIERAIDAIRTILA